jgi:anion-transporting  ArsA/GET3 family ATPase
MLDSKRTFDALIERLAPDEKTVEDVLSNRIYQQLSGAVAGSQEFTAIAKLYELDQEGDFDLLVLDTPPSRNALDFLDAPSRLTGFFQGRAIKMFLRPAGIGGRILGRGTGVVFGLLERLTGVDMLHDLSVFFRALGGMIDGFTERARRVGLLLEDPGTTFLIVTAPRHDPVEEAIFFHRKLRDADMPFGGLVVNRLHTAPDGDGKLPPELAEELARKVDTAAAELTALVEREQASLVLLRETLGDPPTIVIPELDGDVHDIEGLALMREHLF